MDDSFLCLRSISELEDLVFDINASTEGKTIEYIKKADKNLIDSYLQNIIIYVTYRRRFQWKYLANLWNSTINTSVKKMYLNEEFIKSLENPDLSYDNPLFQAILDDNVANLSMLYSLPPIKEEKINIADSSLSQLDFSALCGSVKVFKYLINNGMKIEPSTIENAVRSGKVQILEVLRQKDCDFSRHIQAAVKYHRNDVAQWIMDLYDDEVDIVPAFCILHYNTSFFEFLVKKDLKSINKNTNDKKEYSCLTAAAGVGNIPVTKFLLEKGFDVNKGFRKNKTALHYAASNGNTEFVAFLVSLGASINQKDAEGCTPLLRAAMTGEIETVKEIVKLGGNTSDCNNLKLTAYDIACSNGYKDVVEFLEQFENNEEESSYYEEEEE